MPQTIFYSFLEQRGGCKSLSIARILFQRRGPADDIANLVIFKLNLGSLNCT